MEELEAQPEAQTREEPYTSSLGKHEVRQNAGYKAALKSTLLI